LGTQAQNPGNAAHMIGTFARALSVGASVLESANRNTLRPSGCSAVAVPIGVGELATLAPDRRRFDLAELRVAGSLEAALIAAVKFLNELACTDIASTGDQARRRSRH